MPWVGMSIATHVSLLQEKGHELWVTYICRYLELRRCRTFMLIWEQITWFKSAGKSCSLVITPTNMWTIVITLRAENVKQCFTRTPIDTHIYPHCVKPPEAPKHVSIWEQLDVKLLFRHSLHLLLSILSRTLLLPYYFILYKSFFSTTCSIL